MTNDRDYKIGWRSPNPSSARSSHILRPPDGQRVTAYCGFNNIALTEMLIEQAPRAFGANRVKGLLALPVCVVCERAYERAADQRKLDALEQENQSLREHIDRELEPELARLRQRVIELESAPEPRYIE